MVSGSDVAGEVFALPTILPDTVAMTATSDPDTMYFQTQRIFYAQLTRNFKTWSNSI
jgi:hypothetical protein